MRTSALLFSLLALSGEAFAQQAVTTSVEAQPEAVAPAPSAVAEVGATQANSGLFAAGGPGQGELRWGFGGRTLLVIPMLDASLVYGATSRLSLEMRASAVGAPIGDGSSISFGVFEPGFRYTVSENNNNTLALHGSATLGLGVATGEGEATSALGVRFNPGVVASVAKPRRTFSFGLDVPLSVLEGGVGASTGGAPTSVQSQEFAVGLTPSVTIEKPLEKRALYTQLKVDSLLLGSFLVLPSLAVGLSW